jgi:hypothetical protein
MQGVQFTIYMLVKLVWQRSMHAPLKLELYRGQSSGLPVLLRGKECSNKKSPEMWLPGLNYSSTDTIDYVHGMGNTHALH